MTSEPQLFIGIMSGTSLDGIDTVLVEFGNGHIQLIDALTTPYKPSTKLSIHQLVTNGNCAIQTLCQIDREIAIQYTDCVKQLLKQNKLLASDITAIGCHGQTIKHAPDAIPSFTLQVGDPNTLAAETNITTVADFRRKDIALGGQGAPFAPAFHYHAFYSPASTRIILNIGGIANITLLEKASNMDNITGFDTGPGNTLMDHYCQQFLQLDYDQNGELAAKGTIDADLISLILKNEPYFNQALVKSTGTDYFNLDWLQTYCDISTYSTEDSLANLCELSAQSIAIAIQQLHTSIDEIYCCGGGAHNRTLIKRISQLCNVSVASTDIVGIHPDWVEAIAFAWLAKNTLNKNQTHLNSITSASKNSILGGIFYA